MRPRVQTILARIDALKSNHPQLEAAERALWPQSQASVAESEAECLDWAKPDPKQLARFRRNHLIQQGFEFIVVICMFTEAVALFMLGLAIHP
jgi:hypothetical protein